MLGTSKVIQFLTTTVLIRFDSSIANSSGIASLDTDQLGMHVDYSDQQVGRSNGPDTALFFPTSEASHIAWGWLEALGNSKFSSIVFETL